MNGIDLLKIHAARRACNAHLTGYNRADALAHFITRYLNRKYAGECVYWRSDVVRTVLAHMGDLPSQKHAIDN